MKRIKTFIKTALIGGIGLILTIIILVLYLVSCSNAARFARSPRAFGVSQTHETLSAIVIGYS
jgi:hypothetical protein